MRRSDKSSRDVLVRSALTRILVLAVLWWVLTEGDLQGLYLGVLVIGTATAASLMLHEPGAWRWRVIELPRFCLYFIRLSILGGLDVARRALDPRLPVNPDFFDYPLRLTEEPARVFFSSVMCLIPGTVSVELGAEILRIHVLDRAMPVRETTRALEERVASLFGLDLTDSDSEHSRR